MQVAPGVYAIRAVACTVYLLGGTELTCIDAGGPGTAPRVLSCIRRLEHAPRDLTRVLLTQADLDHAGGLAALVAATGARVYAHPAALAQLAAGTVRRGTQGVGSLWAEVRGVLAPAQPVAVEPLVDGSTLPALGGLQAILTGGHSPDQAAFFGSVSRLLFCGDLLQVVRGHLAAQPGPSPAEREETVAALRRLAALDPLVVFPGHGPVYRDNIAVRLVRLAEILET